MGVPREQKLARNCRGDEGEALPYSFSGRDIKPPQAA